MKRRTLIKTSLAGGAAIVLAGGAAKWLSHSSNNQPLTIEAAIGQLSTMSRRSISSNGDWNPTQVFSHCAQSVEYSMSGFPEHKSTLFKNTAGTLAFSAFSFKGEMTHGLNEPIPGAPALPLKANISGALQRLVQAMLAFKLHKDDLYPHFAYGELSKDEYEVAHVLHLYNHLKEIQAS